MERFPGVRPLFRRYEGNPILTSEAWPYPANPVFNPAAAKLGKKVAPLPRVEDRRGLSHLGRAWREDGLRFQPDPRPALLPEALEEG